MKILRKRDKRKGGRENGESKREIGSNKGRERESGSTAVLMQCPGDQTYIVALRQSIVPSNK